MNSSLEQPFSSPEEEIAWLRSQLEAKTGTEGKEHVSHKEVAKEALREVVENQPRQPGSYALSDDDASKRARALEEEEHHDQIDELMAIAEEKGILSALKVARGLHNPHLLDDFHDQLIATLLFHNNSSPS